MAEIYILTGKINSGKTTSLAKWISTKVNAGGILTHNEHGVRVIEFIGSGDRIVISADRSELNIVQVGNYYFKSDVFDVCRLHLSHLKSLDLDWIVIDEVGPLELQGKGFEPEIKNLLVDRKETTAKILMVVREKILEEFLDHYDLKKSECKIIAIDELDQL